MLKVIRSAHNEFKQLVIFDKIITRNISVSTVFTILSKILFLIIFIFLIQYYSKEDIAAYAFLWAIYGLYLTFSIFGIKDYAIQLFSGHKELYKKNYISLFFFNFFNLFFYSFFFLILRILFFPSINLIYFFVIFLIGLFDSLFIYLSLV